MARKVSLRRRAARPSLAQRLRSDFLTGLAVVLPAFLTIYLIWTVVEFIDARVVPFVPTRYNPENIFGRNILGLGLLIFIVFTTAVGAATKGLFGRRLVLFGEGIVDRMPIVRSVYNAVKQIVDTVLSKTGTSFTQAGLVEYPRKGIWCIAFISTETRGEVPLKAGEPEMLSVFLPTTPNPTSGFLLFVPRRDVVVLDMSIEEAAKLIISAGLVAPPTEAEIASGRRVNAA